jgi:hypothetical protein
MPQLFDSTVAANTTSSPIVTVPGTIVTIESSAYLKVEGETGADLGFCQGDAALVLIATSNEITLTAFDVAADVIVSGEEA